MPASREFIVITYKLFYARRHLDGLLARAISLGSNRSSLCANGSSFKTDSLRSLIAPHESGNVTHLRGLKHRLFVLLFALQGGCVVRCLPYHARSFGQFKAFFSLSGEPAPPVDYDYEHSHQNLS